MKTLAIIPARYASTRFPGKPLVNINGKSMINRVYEQVLLNKKISDIIVATDNDSIFQHVVEFGGKACMTSENHTSGTERCGEVIEKLKDDNFDVVINIQGDEPFINPEQINLLLDCFKNKETQIATLKKKIHNNQDLENPNIVKVVCNLNNYALYFSRFPIPYNRNTIKGKWIQFANYYKHIGIYGFKIEILKQIVQLKNSCLDNIESLEQLKWLENGYKIFVKETEFETSAIDSPEDLQKILLQY